MRSKTVQALEARKAKSEGTEELEQKPSSPSVSGSVFGGSPRSFIYAFSDCPLAAGHTTPSNTYEW